MSRNLFKILVLKGRREENGVEKGMKRERAERREKN